jgi:hypothetical protein
LLPSSFGAPAVVKMPDAKAAANATLNRTSPILRKRPAFAALGDAGRLYPDVSDCVGSNAIKRVAIAVAAGSGRRAVRSRRDGSPSGG